MIRNGFFIIRMLHAPASYEPANGLVTFIPLASSNETEERHVLPSADTAPQLRTLTMCPLKPPQAAALQQLLLSAIFTWIFSSIACALPARFCSCVILRRYLLKTSHCCVVSGDPEMASREQTFFCYPFGALQWTRRTRTVS